MPVILTTIYITMLLEILILQQGALCLINGNMCVALLMQMIPLVFISTVHFLLAPALFRAINLPITLSISGPVLAIQLQVISRAISMTYAYITRLCLQQKYYSSTTSAAKVDYVGVELPSNE